MAKGRLIVIEGLDCSGKATQASFLYDDLVRTGKTVNKLTFPHYESGSSELVKMYLRGDFGQKPGDVNAYAASVFYTVDRYANYKSEWAQKYESGEYFVADRYTTSNAVFQTSKLPREQWDEFLDWLFDFEYRLIGIPEPDFVIYLDVEPGISANLMEGRYHGDESRKDIHERDLEYQRRCRESALYCVQKLGWHKISCTEDGRMLPVERIHGKIMEILGGF